MYVKKCYTPTCTTVISVSHNQQKYCSVCRKKRDRVKALSRKLRYRIGKLREEIQKDFSFKTEYYHDILMITAKRKKSKAILKLSTEAFLKQENEIIIKQALDTLKYLVGVKEL